MSFMDDFLKEMEKWAKSFDDYDKDRESDHSKQITCDHGIIFNKEEASKLLNEMPSIEKDPLLVFVMSSPAHSEIRKRWPRLNGSCPKGCGFKGIAYASYDHYIYGDW